MIKMIEFRMRNITPVIGLLLLSALSISAQQPVTADLSPQHQPHAGARRPFASSRGRLNIDSSFEPAVDGYSDARLQAGLQSCEPSAGTRTGMELSPAPPNDYIELPAW